MDTHSHFLFHTCTIAMTCCISGSGLKREGVRREGEREREERERQGQEEEREKYPGPPVLVLPWQLFIINK